MPGPFAPDILGEISIGPFVNRLDGFSDCEKYFESAKEVLYLSTEIRAQCWRGRVQEIENVFSEISFLLWEVAPYFYKMIFV